MIRTTPPRSWRLGQSRHTAMLLAVAGSLMGLLAAAHAQQPMPPQDKAALVINAARLAYNDRNYPVAVERFRTFLRDFANDRRAPSARYGLALALIEGPDKDYKNAAETLAPAVAQLDPADRPYGQYYLGLAYRGQGNAELDKAAGKGPEGQQSRDRANGFYQQALTQFAAASTSFAALVKAPPAAPAPLSAEMEWAARARCDQAEMLLRLNRAKEALDAVSAWTKDSTFTRSRYRNQGAYLQGYALFMLKDYHAAARSLSALAPFTDPVIGVHARYLLARTHHLAQERPEAVAGYEAVTTGYARDRKAAEEAMKNSAALQKDPDRKAAFESILRSPPPDYVQRAMFYWGILLYEQGRFPDGLARLTLFIQQNPKSPLLPEAQLRAGMAQVQLRAWPEATRLLQPLADNAQLGDQALLWLARAQAGQADPNNAGQFQQVMQSAIATLNRAAERARAIGERNPEAHLRRAEILLETADAMQAIKQYKEAAATYQKLMSEGSAAPDIVETAMQRQAVALHLAGQYRESREICQRFLQTYPRSVLLPEVVFRQAENAFLTAAATQGNPTEAKRLYGESVALYQQVVEKAADSPYINVARQGLGTAHYQLGKYEDAAKVLATIPEAERTGELATVSYLLADCLLHTLPADADDALSTARMIEQLESVSTALTAFISAQPNSPQVPDALLKLGFAQQRSAAAIADPVDQRKAIAKARQAYTTFVQKYASNPQFPTAVFENAKCLAQLGDIPSAIGELNRFQNDPLRKASIAPLALIRLGDYMRIQRRAAEAVNLLNQVKSQHEAALLQDPARADWAALLNYNLGLALKDAGKPAEARAVFEKVISQFPNRPEATEALWRNGQARRDEATARIDAARKALGSARNADETARAKAALAQALASLREVADYFQNNAAALAQKPAAAEVRARLLYEAAWCNRTLGEDEIEAAREKLAQDALRKLQERTKDPAVAQGAPSPRPPEIRIASIPLQPSEQRMRDQYKAIIVTASESPLANDARFELADQLAKREEYDPAIKLLVETLSTEPPHELIDRIRIRLGACYLAKNDAKNALPLFNAILQNPRSVLAPHARYGMAECMVLQKNWAGAMQQLSMFRDNDAMRNIPGTSDRALLRLGQAMAQLGQWEPSRQVMEMLMARFPNSPLVPEARYNAGYALQMLKRYDEAVAAYTDVTNRTGTEIAAKAQLQIGLCRLEQKRPKDAAAALMVVPYTYDYPETSAASLCEAARAYVELKQPSEATKALQRVLKETPTGRWAELAQKRMAELK